MQDFNCLRCGFCCQLDVVLGKADHQRIRAAGKIRYSRKKHGESILKRRGKYCIFYRPGACSIYDFRPDACRRFPFEHDGSIGERCLQRKDFSSQVTQKVIKFMVSEIK
jgi:Fe-S-cluster containining protein